MDGAEILQALAARSREAASSSEDEQKNSGRGPGIASRLKKSAQLLKLTLSRQTVDGSRSVLRLSEGC